MLSDELTQDHPTLDATALAAIEWEVRLRDHATSEERMEFDTWRLANPAHQMAWDRLQARLSSFGSLKDASGTAVHRALQEPSHVRRRMLKLSAGVATGLFFGVGTSKLVAHYSLDADYSNGQGTAKTLALNNGIPVTLGASTRLYGPDKQRREGFYLASGQLATGSTANLTSPFVVTTRDGMVRVDGARLSIEALRLHTIVGIQGGEAILSSRSGSHVRAPAGTAWTVSASHITRIPETSADIFAWTHGTLVVLDRAVSDVVETLGRYFRGYVRFPKSALSRRVSGVFPLQNAEAALRQLAEGLGLSFAVYGEVLAVASDR
jgi:transmembrane sensor